MHQTLTRYLRSVKPLESDEKYQRLEKEAEEFESGIGRKLQLYLILKSWWSSNYVSLFPSCYAASAAAVCGSHGLLAC